MQPEFTTDSTAVPPSPPESPRFLIPPSQRLRFVLLFTFVTGLSQLLGSLILRTWFERFFIATDEVNIIVQVSLNAAVLGVSIGSAQWFVLRNYLPSWLWIVATSVGYAISSVILEAFKSAIDVIMPLQGFQDFDIKFIIFATILRCLTPFCYLWLGLALFIFIRRYVRVSWWWSFLPPAGIFLSLLLFILFSFILVYFPDVYQRVNLSNIAQIVQGCAIGFVEALGFCRLRKKASEIVFNSTISTESPLFSAPEITDIKLTQKLSKMLYQQIDRSWQSETTSKQELIYLLGVAEDGSIVTYQPINQAAIDHLNETPLPDLVTISESDNEETANQQPLARFQVIFTPPAGLKVRPWRG